MDGEEKFSLVGRNKAEIIKHDNHVRQVMPVACEALPVEKQFFGVKAVAFDVYGTLVHIGDPRRPYRRMLSALNDMGRAPSEHDGARIMSVDVGLAEAAELLGMTLPGDVLQELTVDLSAELASISLFEDAIPAIRLLKDRGIRIGLCSNLAGPYAKPVEALLQPLDAYAWSFAVGAVKPEHRMYSYLCDELGASPEQILMVGDTLSADYTGPISFGMQACHLARKRSSEAKVWISTLMEIESLIGR